MKVKKVFIIYILINLILFNTFISATEIEQNISDVNITDVEVYAPSALLIEKETGEILFSKDAYSIRYPASTVKIMTAILALERTNFTDVVTVSESSITSVPSGYSISNIKAGENLTLENLLYALLLPSGNDAANVIAEYVGGSVTEFANMMNKKAADIGCKNTIFTNPNGVHDENMHTTAYDLALIARYAMNNTAFREIVSTSTYTMPSSNIYPDANRTYQNSNHLVNKSSADFYEYATGIKTGFTNAAQNCLVSSAKKENVEFIAVVLGATESNFGEHSKFKDTKNLFEYAFNNYFDYYEDLYIKKVNQKNSLSTKIIETLVDTNMIVDEKNSPRWGYVIYLIAKFTLILIAIIYVLYLIIIIIKKYIYKKTHAKYKFKY